MSCYEWERGTLVLPARQYSGFRRTIIEAWNSRRLELLERAAVALPVIRTACKGKSSWEASDAALEIAARHWDEPFELVQLVMNSSGGKTVFRSPKKKDIGLKPVSRACTLDIGDACISFNDAARAVTWSVEENNHARESARAHPVARRLFSELARVDWVRGTGGTIVGNDEYNRDADYEGGGGNYVTSAFGPLGKPRRY